MSELDRQILELVAQRLETSKAIGEAKRQANLPIRDFKVEVEVLSRARRAALELGFDSELAEKVLELLVAAAVQTQAEQPTGRPRAGHRKILVVGGSGRMGAWLHHFLETQGHEVHNCDPQAGPTGYRTLEEADPSRFDVIAVATPLGATPKVLEEVLAGPGNPLVFDIGSLKSQIAPVLLEAAARGKKVTSLHPMFAPGAVLLSGRAVLLCDAGDKAAVTEARELFEGTALSLYEVTLEEHDRIMAVVLGMSHAVNLLFGATLPRFGLPFSLLGQVSSTTFSKQVKTSAEVAEENPLLYHEIQHLNRHTDQVYELFGETLRELREASRAEAPQPFSDLMAQAADYFKGS